MTSNPLLFGLDWITTLQSTFSHEYIITFYKFITFFGGADCLLLFLPFIYYFNSHKKAVCFGIITFLNLLVNVGSKLSFNMPRPFHLDESLGLIHAGNFGFPSGHSHLAIYLWGSIALIWLKKYNYIKALSIFMIVNIIFSRLYLGVHFPIDLIGGSILGIIGLITLKKYINKDQLISNTIMISLIIFFLIVTFIFFPNKDLSSLLGAYLGFVLAQILYAQSFHEKVYDFGVFKKISTIALILIACFTIRYSFKFIPTVNEYFEAILQILKYTCMTLILCGGIFKFKKNQIN